MARVFLHKDGGRGSKRELSEAGVGQLSPLRFQRYLDEAEREKQQYIKELREYQQSEAYKLCAENKVKKGVCVFP